MDHSNGFVADNVPLPMASILTKPGLVLLLKHPSVCERIVKEHVSDLQRAIIGKTFMCPIYREPDLNKKPIDEVREVLRRERDTAIEQGRLQFMISSYFPPRITLFQEYSEVIYLYTTGRSNREHLLGITHARGRDLKDLTLEQAYCQIKRNPETEVQEKQKQEMTITVSGRVHSGRSAVSAIIQRALEQQWPDIPVIWDDPDHTQHQVLANLDAGRYRTIDTTSFAIHNTTKVKTP